MFVVREEQDLGLLREFVQDLEARRGALVVEIDEQVIRDERHQIQIMVINIQSFQKDVADKDLAEMTEDELKKLNVINRENDRMSGRRPIEFIQAANPIVIIDEPQSVDNTEKSRRAIGNLNPMVTLRYSATHRNPYNRLYKLDPIRAYDLPINPAWRVRA